MISRALLWAPVLLLFKARAHGFVRPVHLASIGIRTSSTARGSSPKVQEVTYTYGASFIYRSVVLRTTEPSPPLVIEDKHPRYPLNCFDLQRHYLESGELDSVMIPVGMIEDRVDKLASDVLHTYMREGVTELRLLCVLKGASRFFHALVETLQRNVVASGCELRMSFEFVKAKSYEGTSSTGNVKLDGVEPSSLQGRHILLVEDIVDTGNTLSKLLPYLESLGPSSVRVVTLLEKRVEKRTYRESLALDFVGFSIPDTFIVGYNMDYNEQYRDLAHLCMISAKGIEMHKDK